MQRQEPGKSHYAEGCAQENQEGTHYGVIKTLFKNKTLELPL